MGEDIFRGDAACAGENGISVNENISLNTYNTTNQTDFSSEYE